MCGKNHICKVNHMKEMATVNGHPRKERKEKKNMSIYNINRNEKRVAINGHP